MPEAQLSASRIGVFGSAFNPPHIGHVVLLAEARWQLDLDRVLIVPTGEPYHKRPESDPGPAARLALARAAFGGIEATSVTSIEIERPGPSYTCVTLEEIADENEDSEIHLLMGADTATGFGAWKRPERILELAEVAVAPRPGDDRRRVVDVFESLGGVDRFRFVEMPAIEVSSGLIRERVEAGLPFQHLVPPEVARMIDNEGAYGPEQ